MYSLVATDMVAIKPIGTNKEGGPETAYGTAGFRYGAPARTGAIGSSKLV
jgi:hypothetical protein